MKERLDCDRCHARPMELVARTGDHLCTECGYEYTWLVIYVRTVMVWAGHLVWHARYSRPGETDDYGAPRKVFW